VGNTKYPASIVSHDPEGKREGMIASKVREFCWQHLPSYPDSLIEVVTIRQPSDILGASRVMARVAEDHGMRLMILHDISSQQMVADADGKDVNTSVFGWQPDVSEFWQNYDCACRSPIIRACRLESEPFWVNRHGFRTIVPNAMLDGIDLDDFEVTSILTAAIVVPVFLPFGQIAVAIFSSRDQNQHELSNHFAEFIGLFSNLSRRFLTTYAAITRDNPYLPAEAVLTLREVECLRWAAFGKTDKEIAVILDLSHATIRYYLMRICKKLDAVNRAQAIFRASQLGYLGSEK
jgi:DNA-binding CsgD family transcriptional regulator